MFTGFLGATFYLVAEAQTHLSESPGPLSPVIRLPPHLAPGWCWATLVSSSSLSVEGQKLHPTVGCILDVGDGLAGVGKDDSGGGHAQG